jgi:hypothetical protein
MVGKGMLIKLNRDLYHIVPSNADANTYIPILRWTYKMIQDYGYIV